MRFIVMIIIV